MRVLIVDDHLLFIDAIRAILAEAGADEVHIATTGREALEVVDRVDPDVVLMDLGLPDRSGLSVGREILERWPDRRVIALTAVDDPKIVRQASRAGFLGYITKDTPVPQFASALRAAMNGQSSVSRRLANGDDRRVEADREVALADQLTERERDVLALLASGMSGAKIARALSISANTVRTHVQSILAKLQVHSRLEAFAFAVRNGLVANGSEARHDSSDRHDG